MHTPRVVSVDSTYRFPKIKYERSSFLSGLFPLVLAAMHMHSASMHNNCNDDHDTTTTTLESRSIWHCMTMTCCFMMCNIYLFFCLPFLCPVAHSTQLSVLSSPLP